MKFRKPQTKKGWEKYCHDLWSYAVRLRDKFICQYSHKKYNADSRGLHPHHIITKGSARGLRFDLDNGISLSCYYHRNVAHCQDIRQVGVFKEWIIDKKGQEWYDELVYRAGQYRKVDLEETAKILEDVITELEGGGLCQE